VSLINKGKHKVFAEDYSLTFVYYTKFILVDNTAILVYNRRVERITGKITEEIYLGQPMKTFEGTRIAPADDPSFGRVHLGKEFKNPVELAIHPNDSRKIIINVPGYNGDIDGYAEKYKKLANLLQDQNVGAVVRTGNFFRDKYLPDYNLRTALEYSQDNALEICGKENPEIMLMGFSAGASAIAAVACEYPQVSKILLQAPSGDMPTVKNLRKFTGEVVIVNGEDDEVVGSGAGPLFYSFAESAKKRELFMIPDCDHQFRGEKNGRIMS
jgi:hypothetical protein